MEDDPYHHGYDADYHDYHGTVAADPQQQQQQAQQELNSNNTAAAAAAYSSPTTTTNSSSRSAQGQAQPVMVNLEEREVAALPRILLMGPRRSGKTSIQRVVFHKMSPHETLFRLEATQDVERAVVDHTPLCRFTIWDFPGDYYGADDEQQPQTQQQQHSSSSNTGGVEDEGDAEQQPTMNNANNNDSSMLGSSSSNSTFAGAGVSLIFVMDAQDEPYDHVLQSFTNVVSRALQANPFITIEVFINKVDGELFLSDETKYDCRRDIVAQVTEELADNVDVDPNQIQIRYHLTSIYDHSIYEALSRVIQRLIPQLPTLENLLNVLVNTSSMEKAYLFDVVSKLYISTDSSPVDMQSVELCSDMIDVVLDVSGIYGLGGGGGARSPTTSLAATAAGTDDEDGGSAHGNKHSTTTDQEAIVEADQETTLISQAPNLEEEMIDPDSAYDSESASVIRLSNGMVLYLKEVDQMLALVCITRSENFRKKSLINYNIACLKKALGELMKPTNGRRGSGIERQAE